MSAQRILASGAAALLVLIVLAIAFHGSSSSTPATPPPTAPGTLRAHAVAGSVTLDGPVADAAEQRTIEAAAADRFGQANVVSRLHVQAGASSAAWIATAVAALPKSGKAVNVIVTKSAVIVSGRVANVTVGHKLLQAVESASGRKVTDDLKVGEVVSGPLQQRIDAAVGGRSISFTTGSAGITKSGQTVLKALVVTLKGAGSSRVVVGGYTDNVGKPADNLKLSQARAHSVVVWLTGHGVPVKVLVAKGYGAAHPIASNDTAAGRNQNRRIEFTVLGG
jgi:OmpA-OmpF porin, OOP family